MQSFLFRTTNSASQISVYGAAADWCGEVAQLIPNQSLSSIEKSAAKMNEQLNRKMAPEKSENVGTST